MTTSRARLLLAVDIGGTNHSVALVRADGAAFEIVEKVRRPTDREGGRRWLLPRIETECRELLARAPEPPAACGIGFGGPVDFAAQRVRRSLHAGGWSGFPLAERLGKTLGLPCVIENDANTAALGEFTYGAGCGARSLIYLTVSTGVGGGLMLDGELYRGVRSLAGEAGHLMLEPGGPRCSCGRRGCVEALCSGTALGRAAREAARRNPPAWRAVEERDARAVFDAARRGHSAAQSLVEDYCEKLGRTVATLLTLLDPGTVVIGGGISLAGAVLFVPLRRAIARHLPPFLSGKGAWRCRPAALGDNSVLAGAAELALRAAASAL